MANTRHTYQLHSKEIEEIIRNNGLPDEISTETQLWDLIITVLPSSCFLSSMKSTEKNTRRIPPSFHSLPNTL